jgi:hypothetical protein
MNGFKPYLLFLYIVLSINNLIREVHPIQYQNFLMNVTYYSIYFYSKVQIIIKNAKDFLNKNIPFHLVYEINSDSSIIEVIFQGNVINIINKNQINSLLDVNYDFILYSKKENGLIHKRIIYSDNLDINNEKALICEPSEIKFILTEIILEDKKINVDFKIKNHNYYVCDNIFYPEFIVYFLNKYYTEEIKHICSDKLLNYQVEILDQNVNKEVFNFKNNIKINKNDYTIFNK